MKTTLLSNYTIFIYKTKRWLFLPIIIIMLFSCEDFVVNEVDDIDLPGSESQLVVYSYISPQDTLIRVHVKRSVPYINENNDIEPVKDKAHVHLAKNNGEYHKLEYDDNYGCFVISPDNFNIEEDNTYFLKVESFDGETVEAECYVPELKLKDVEILDVEFSKDEWGNGNLSISWSITPESDNMKNYYNTGAYIVSEHLASGKVNSTLNSIEADSNEQHVQKLYMETGTPYFIDKDGNSYGFLARTNIPNHSIFEADESVFVYIIQTDYHHYEFHRSADDYFYYDDGFPFSEGVRIYSNIQNGLGLFAGYNKKIIEVEL